MHHDRNFHDQLTADLLQSIPIASLVCIFPQEATLLMKSLHHSAL